jgi:hypothetical protein
MQSASAAPTSTPTSRNEPPSPARWTRPFVAIDRYWTQLETALVVVLLLLAIFYMTGWVTLNAFHTKAGKMARYPSIVALFSGASVAITWARAKQKRLGMLLLSVVLLGLGAVLWWAAKKQEYFANVARWLADASVLKQVGTPQIVSARMFTIWVALLGGSLATGAGRQINIDVVMRFIGPKPRLFVALIGYLAAASACFVVSWGFVDWIGSTRYGGDKDLKPKEKIAIVSKGFSRHMFVVGRQLRLDARSFVHVVLKGEPADKWYTGAEWNKEVNEGGWVSVFPQPPMPPREPPTVEPGQPPPPPPPPPPSKPCLSAKELEDLGNAGGSMNPDWKLPAICDGAGDASTRLPFAGAPEPDDRAPLEADLSMLFPLGFLMIGLRFVLRSVLAIGGAVSTDPNAAHGGDEGHAAEVAVHEPIAEHRVDQEARAHEGEGALPADDVRDDDALGAQRERLSASVENLEAKAEGGSEPAHHEVADVGDKNEEPRRLSSRPPAEGIKTAERLEVAQKVAAQEEEETTLVGDLSELARAQELLEAKKGGAGGGDAAALKAILDKQKLEAAKRKGQGGSGSGSDKEGA